MANYSLIINSKCNPFSYQEMLAPVLMATQAHQNLEDQYGELSTKANVWEEMANEQTDPYAYKMYKTYANDLAAQADKLAREGLNATSRRDMLNMKSRYSKEITPIENAYQQRQKQAEMQQQALLQDPTLMLSRRASTTSLDDYIKNPQLAYDVYSGKLLTAQVAQAASALAKELRNNPKNMKELVGGDFYEYVKQRGFSSQAVLAAIKNKPEASSVLTNLIDSTIDATGIKNWGNNSIIQQAYDYARQGLWNAVGQDEVQLVNNWRAQENLSNAHAMARQKAAQAFQKSEREATQKFQREQAAPKEIVGADGKGTGSYYDPKIGMVVDKNGRVMQGQNGNISKVGTESRGQDTTKSNVVINVAGATPKSLSRVTKLSDIKSQGLTPVMVVIPHGKGSYQWGKSNEDLGAGNRRIVISENTGMPELIDPNNPSKGYKIQTGKRAFFGGTESRAVTSWGNIHYPTENLEYMPDETYARLPIDVQASIRQAALDAGVQPGQPYVIYRVPGRSSTFFGRENPKDSYIIFKNNEYK